MYETLRNTLLKIILISIYQLGDVGISSCLIGSLSLANGQCPPPATSQRVNILQSETMAGVNSRLAIVTGKESLLNVLCCH